MCATGGISNQPQNQQPVSESATRIGNQGRNRQPGSASSLRFSIQPWHPVPESTIQVELASRLGIQPQVRLRPGSESASAARRPPPLWLIPWSGSVPSCPSAGKILAESWTGPGPTSILPAQVVVILIWCRRTGFGILLSVPDQKETYISSHVYVYIYIYKCDGRKQTPSMEMLMNDDIDFEPT